MTAVERLARRLTSPLVSLRTDRGHVGLPGAAVSFSGTDALSFITYVAGDAPLAYFTTHFQ